MQTHKKLKARILSLALSAAMVTTMMPMNVFAAEGGTTPGTSTVGIIQSFDKLEVRFIPSVGENAPDYVYTLSVALNTPFEDLDLPDELTAMVERTNVTAPAEDENTPNEDEAVDEDTAADDTGSDNQPASPSDAKEEVKEEIKGEDVPLAPELEQGGETVVTTVKQETIPVTWQSNKEYKSDENGKFIYTAVLTEDYILADGVELPQIYVMVGRQEQPPCTDIAASNILLDKLLAHLAGQQTMIAGGGADVTTTDEFKALAAEIDALYAHMDACHICAAQMSMGGTYYEKFYGTQTLATNVCEIAGTGYDTLQAALDAVTNGQTIKVLSDITQIGGVARSVGLNDAVTEISITIDLNGFDLNITGDATKKNGISISTSNSTPVHLTLTDSSSTPGSLTTTGYADSLGSSNGLSTNKLTI